MKEYRKTATVKAKIFKKGDEDGMIHRDGMLGALELMVKSGWLIKKYLSELMRKCKGSLVYNGKYKIKRSDL